MQKQQTFLNGKWNVRQRVGWLGGKENKAKVTSEANDVKSSKARPKRPKQMQRTMLRKTHFINIK